ncbi:MAG TPA: hypothetical protein PKH77_26090 [Anaerolineae bacterium]|nr:hypothetical protein [Anaerolineae bacterium]
MPFDNERIARAVKTSLEAGMTAALETVAASWAEDPLPLPDVATYFYGHKPTVLELPSAAFPFLAVVPTGRRALRTTYGWGFQDQNPTVYVDWFVVAEDETTVDKLCSRYAEAILRVLQSQRAYAGYEQVDYEPAIDLSEASRHPKTPAANLFDAGDVDFIKMGRMTLEFGGNG